MSQLSRVDPPDWATSDRLGGGRYGDLVEAVRAFTDLVATSDPPDALVDEAERQLRRLAAGFAPYQLDGPAIPAGQRWDLPSRGHPTLVPFETLEQTDTAMRGSVRLGRRHTGTNGVAHGGVLPLLFDEVLGVFPTRLNPPARTASLQVSYLAPTPIDMDLDLWAEVTKRDDRKMWVEGGLSSNRVTIVTATGLFIQPRC
jgi:acyl-coenzyme A thioesterase PaaI-like protein